MITRDCMRRTQIITFLIISGLLIGMPSTPASGIAGCKKISLVAHRGLTDARHTENSYRSLSFAAKEKADAVEFDIRLTADDKWILMHDDTVNRTTNGTGKVSSLTAAQIKEFKLNDSKPTGTVHRVPYLSTVMSKLTNNYPSLSYQVELKDKKLTDEQITKALDTIYSYTPKKKVIITSFELGSIQQVNAISPDTTTALIARDKADITLSEAKTAGVDYVLLHQNTVGAKYVSRVRALGMGVMSYGAQSNAQFRHVVQSGVNDVVIDDFIKYKSWCSR